MSVIWDDKTRQDSPWRICRACKHNQNELYWWMWAQLGRAALNIAMCIVLIRVRHNGCCDKKAAWCRITDQVSAKFWPHHSTELVHTDPAGYKLGLKLNMSKYWDKKGFKFFIVAILSRHKWTGPGQQYTQNITKYIISFLLYGVKSNAENIQD